MPLLAGDVFFTVSEPELHDPHLHTLLDRAICGDADRSYLGRDDVADEVHRRKRAVVDYLGIVVWWFMEKVRSLHHRCLYPMWGVMPVKPDEVPMERYVPVDDNMLPKPDFAPVEMGMHGMRIEFAHRRNMSHGHGIFALPDSPDMHVKLAAICDPKGPEARSIVLWVAEKLQLCALHPTHDRAKWPAPEGSGKDVDASLQAPFAACQVVAFATRVLHATRVLRCPGVAEEVRRGVQRGRSGGGRDRHPQLRDDAVRALHVVLPSGH